MSSNKLVTLVIYQFTQLGDRLKGVFKFSEREEALFSFKEVFRRLAVRKSRTTSVAEPEPVEIYFNRILRDATGTANLERFLAKLKTHCVCAHCGIQQPNYDPLRCYKNAAGEIELVKPANRLAYEAANPGYSMPSYDEVKQHIYVLFGITDDELAAAEARQTTSERVAPVLAVA